MEPLTSDFWLNEAALLHDVVWDIVEEAATTAAINAAQGVIQQLLGVGAPAVDFNLLNAAAYEYAQSHAFALVSQITATTQAALQTAMAEWIYSDEPLPALIDKLAPMFGPVRAEAIAVTEITRIYAHSNIIGWRQYGVNTVRYNTAVDDVVCPICQPHQGHEYAIEQGDIVPPLHVRCRCWLQPVVKIAGVNA